MNINQPSVWHSIEFDCIARDFSYAQYVQTHYDLNCKSVVVSENMYLSLSSAFYTEMVRDIASP